MEQEILEEFGLNERESKIYLALIRERLANANKLAKLTKINRTTVYLELDNLLNKGLASYVIKDSKRYYQAADPGKFVEILETKKAKIESIMPQLKGLAQPIEPFKIEVYEGKEGLKTFYQDIMNNAKEVLAFGVTGNAFEVLKFEFPHFVKAYMKKGIKARYLANSGSKKLLSSLPKAVKIKFVPEKCTGEVTTIIYGKKVAIQSLKKGNIYALIIKDQPLYNTYKNYFELMWDKI